MLIIPIFITFLTWTVESKVWRRREQLDSEGDVVLSWDVDVKYEMLTLHVEVKSTGVMAVGFSPDGFLSRADFAVGWMSHGVGSVVDMYVDGEEMVEDERQDYQLLFGSENETHTILEFQRKFDTCDLRDWKITNNTVRVMFAYQDEDPTNRKIVFHSNAKRGQRSLYLLEDKRNHPQMTPDVKIWDVRLPNVALIGIDTIYKCQIFKAPKTSTKHQVIGFEPLLESKSRVYHMILYECHVKNSETIYESHLNDRGQECYTSAMPKIFTHCSTVVIAWGVGSDGDATPMDVGFPLGEEFGGASYFMLEVHFELEYKQSVIDNSGLRLFITSKTRANDASVINIGHVVSPLQIIPPKEKEFVSVAHCGSSCTKKSLPDDGINIFGVVFQAHLLATHVTLRHIRDGIELPPIIDDRNYDPFYLQAHQLSQQVKLLPGDHLMLECTYDTTSKNNTVVGGLNMDNEMCLVFIHYFPRAELSECQSWPAIDILTSWFNIKLGQQINGFVVEDDQQISSKSLREFLERYRWSGKGRSFQREIQYGQYFPFCLLEGRFPANLSVVAEDYPQITYPHYIISEQCSVNSSQEPMTSYTKVSDSKTIIVTTMEFSVTSEDSNSDWLGGAIGQWSSSTTLSPLQPKSRKEFVNSASSNESWFVFGLACLVMLFICKIEV